MGRLLPGRAARQRDLTANRQLSTAN